MKVAVIGGGPSGLVTPKYLLNAHLSLESDPIEVRLFELDDTIGGVFATRVYEDAELVSSKQLTIFSDFRCRQEKDFLSATDYLQYLKDYCTHFNLWPHITLRVEVQSVTSTSLKLHTISYSRKDGRVFTWGCDAVAVCSGLHKEPNLPVIPGLHHVPEVIHSSNFKTKSQFEINKTVMVIGSGETGTDVAYLAVTSPTKQVLMCHKDGFHFAPKRNPGPVLLPILGRKPNPNEPGIPIDVSRANLFDTTYVHPVLRNSMILWDYYCYYIKSLFWVSSGTTFGMDQWIGEISKSRHHPSKSPKLWLYALRSAFVQTPIPDTHGKQVDLAPLPKIINKDGTVEFFDNGRPEFEQLKHQVIRPDMIVLCTGYKQSFPFLQELFQGEQKHPSSFVRGIWEESRPELGFMGFMRPSLGAIPPLAEMQAQLWVLNLVSPHKVARLKSEDEEHYRLHTKSTDRVTYGVDHESYAYQLALDMNSAPGFTDILSRATLTNVSGTFRLLIIWAFGAHFNTKFRLMGPWAWEGAEELLVSNEFWETITRRPILFANY
ncbi:hypothetical protein ACHAQC_005344 [Fusarium culmorum]